MKKRVRIYKPINKFAEGGEQSMEFTPDQLTSIYMTALSEPGASQEEAENTLRQIGVDENTIAQISETVESYVDDEQYFNDALGTADEDAFTDITADQAAEEAAYQEELDALAAAEEEARSARMQQMYADYSEPDYGDDADISGQILMKTGGLPSKRTFMRNVIKQVKKQTGGLAEKSTVDSTDPDNKRKTALQDFTSAVQVDGNIHLAKEDAEKMYKMLSTPIGQDQSYYEEPDMDYAQFGGMRRGQMRRMNRRLNRMIGRLPIGIAGAPGGFMLPTAYDYTDLVGAFGVGQMPADGSYYRGPKLANIDVRRTGLFGRPKEYTITFADDVVNNPQTAENTVKQEVINKEEEVKDEAKAAEEGTVDQGVEEKKAEEAAAQAEEEAVDINDIQVVSGSGSGSRKSNAGAARGTSAEDYVSSSEEVPAGKTPSFKGFWKGYDPKSVRFAGNDKSRAYIQRGNKWFVSPNFASKDKKNVQWYEVSDPTRIKNIKASTKPIMDPLAPGSTYTVSDPNGTPLSRINNYGKQYSTSTEGVSDKEIIEGLNAYANKKIPTQARKYPPMSVKDFFLSGQVFNTAGEALNDEFKRYSRPTNLNVPVSKTAPRQTIGMGEKFQGGGFTDQSSGLYQFVYGGEDNIFALTPTPGELTNSPYFEYGGLHKAAPGEQTDSTVVDIIDANGNVVRQGTLAEAERAGLRHRIAPQQKQNTTTTTTTQKNTGNTNTGYIVPAFKTKQKGLPYYTGTKDAYTGSLDNAKLANIQVKKSFALGPNRGMPKKYTVNYQVQKHPLTGQTTTAPTTQTKQGIFNRGERQQMFGKRPDTAFESRSRALSWLGSKLRPIQIESDKVDINQNPDQWGIDQLVEDTKRRQNAEMVAQTQLPTKDITQTNLPEQQLQRTPFVNTPSGISQSLPIRRPGQIPTNVQDAEIIPTQYSAPLAPGTAGPLSQREAEIKDLSEAQKMQEEQDMRGFGMNLLGMPTAQEQYLSEAADQNTLDVQRAEIQRMIEQNPDFYTQGVYNNPVFNPEDMTTSNIINLNPEPVQQIPVNREVNPVVNRATTPRRNVVPTKKTGKDKKQEVVKQNTQVPVVGSDSTKVTAPVKETTKKEQANTPKKPSKQEQSKAYTTPEGSTNYVGNEAAQKARDQVLREIEKNKSKREQFKKSYGVDKATLDLFRALRSMPGTEAQQRAMIQANPGLKKYYKVAYGGYMAYGGTLPQAVIGEDTPINQDERLAPDYESVNWGADFNQDNIPDYLGASTTDMNWKNNTDWMRKPAGFNEQGQYSIQKAVEDMNPQYENVSVDYKNKQWGLTNTGEGQLLAQGISTLGNWAIDKLGERGDKDKQRQMYDRLTADALYGSTGMTDRGWIDTNSGLDIPNQYGQRLSAKYGGGLEEMAFGGRRFMNRLYDKAFEYNEDGEGPPITSMSANRRGLFRKNYNVNFEPPQNTGDWVYKPGDVYPQSTTPFTSRYATGTDAAVSTAPSAPQSVTTPTSTTKGPTYRYGVYSATGKTPAGGGNKPAASLTLPSSYKEGGVTWLSPEQVKWIIENGGEIEFVQ